MAALVLVSAFATADRAVAAGAGSCGLQLKLDYVGADRSAPGDPVRVRLRLGTEDIEHGTKLNLRTLRFFLQCNADASRLLPCPQDTTVVSYAGDDRITTTCDGVVWSTGHAIGGRPNQVVFTPSPALDIPANTPAYCDLEFDVIVVAGSRDATPDVAEQVVAAGFQRPDAVCDNGLRAVSAVTGGIMLAP